MSYPRLARILYNNPLLIEPSKAEVIEAVFRSYVEGNGISGEEAAEQEFAAGIGRSKLLDDSEVRSARAGKGYFMVDGGIAIVPILGTLVQRSGGMDAFSGIQSYQAIASALQAAVSDHRALGILMEIDSPGGEAAGLFDLAGQLREIAAAKPLWAAANEFAFSAAYAIGSQATYLSLPESGGVGSVGVMMMHVDKSESDKKRGMKYTPIYAGARKVDLSSHAPLSPEARASVQATVDNLYELFVNAVAVGRGIDASVPRSTQAALLGPEQAKSLGMANAVESFRQTLAQFRDELNAPRQLLSMPPSSKGNAMSDANAANAAEESRRAAEAAAALSKATADGQAAATARIKGILSHAEASGREKLAQHFAFNTSMSVDDAGAALAAAPKEAQAAAGDKGGSEFAKHMEKQAKAAIDADNPPASGGQAPIAVKSAAQIYEMRAKQSKGSRA